MTALDVNEMMGNCCRDFREAVDRALGNLVETLLARLKSKSKRLAKVEENVDRFSWVGGVASRLD
jgi:hypothetical protein